MTRRMPLLPLLVLLICLGLVAVSHAPSTTGEYQIREGCLSFKSSLSYSYNPNGARLTMIPEFCQTFPGTGLLYKRSKVKSKDHSVIFRIVASDAPESTAAEAAALRVECAEQIFVPLSAAVKVWLRLPKPVINRLGFYSAPALARCHLYLVCELRSLSMLIIFRIPQTALFAVLGLGDCAIDTAQL